MVWVETVGGAFLSAFLQVLFDRLASPRFMNFFSRQFDDTGLIQKLKTILLTVNAVLCEAEEKQITNSLVKKWVDELKDAVYLAEDLIDEIAFLALSLDQASVSQVSQSSTSNNVSQTCEKYERRLNEVITKLETMAKHKDVLGVKEGFGGKPFSRLPTTSLVDEQKVYGRDEDKKKIIDFLISDREYGKKEIPVIAITGMAGVGKTTLAQILYNDASVIDRFSERAWVYVSEEFDVFKLTKTIYESMSLPDFNTTDLNLIQIKLKKEMAKKRFLLILDDVWNEDFIKWDLLQNCFKDGSEGSRIIVTTRSQSVASTMQAVLTHPLGQLDDKDCWSVFSTHAFRNTPEILKLKKIGEEIVRRCQGLPLSAKILGSLLHSKVETHEWEKILHSKIWDLQDDKINILPSLRLSYYHLPPHVKQCFAYCSILPKRCVFEKEKLVLLWMAGGFLQQPKGERRIEEVGNDYFNELLSRSFFQQSNNNKLGFVMHDLVNDLAQFVSGEFCSKFERDKPLDVSEKTRHFSYARDQISATENFENLREAKFLRTFLPVSSPNSSGSSSISNHVIEKLLPELRYLRILSLSDNLIIKFPDTFANFKLLRFLDFSGTRIKVLPESTCLLYNLETLMLSRCTDLTELPAKMRKLINLCYLDLDGTNLMRMPPRFGRLKNLQRLTTFVVSNNTEASSRIRELGGLVKLCGKLSISGLEHVEDGDDAENAKLKDKKNIKELIFAWKNDRLDQQRETVVLEKLQPHENIEILSIVGYNGTKLPDWLGYSAFTSLVILHIDDCKNCSSCPSIGQLSSLQNLHVRNCPKLTMKLPDYFPSLELLRIDECCQLEFPSNNITGYGNLQNLEIKSSCDSLTSFTLNSFNKLKHLHFHNCKNLNCIEVSDKLHQKHEFLQHFEISNCDGLESVSRGMHTPNLTYFSVSTCNSLRSMPEQMHAPNLTSFSVSNCDSLPSMPEQMHAPNLTSFSVSNCNSLRSMPKQMHSPNLTSFSISNCDSLRSMPEQMHAPNLTPFSLSNCNGLRSMSEQIMHAPNLTSFSVSNCDSLPSMPEQMHAPNLTSFSVSNCNSLQSMPEQMHAPNLTSFSVSECNNLKSMPDQMPRLLTSLENLNISYCPELELFPNGDGLPPNLREIWIKNCDRLTPHNNWGLNNMVSLSVLSITGGCREVTSFPDDGLLPVSLTVLEISDFPVLETLDLSGLQKLTSLKNLHVNCVNLRVLSDGRLPRSLNSLSITGCSSLTQRCKENGGEYWDKISDISMKEINGRRM